MKKFLHNMPVEVTVPSLPTMERQLRRIAMESQFSGNLVELFRDQIPGFYMHVKQQTESLYGIASQLFDKNGEDVDFSALGYLSQHQFNIISDDVISKLPAYSYTAISSTVIPVPENFSGDLLDYTQFMTKNDEKVIYEATLNLLSVYETILADFLSNKDSKVSLISHDHLYKKAVKVTEDLGDVHKKFFPLNTNKSRARLGDCFSRLNDVQEFSKLYPNLLNTFNKAPVKAIKQASDRCVSLLSLVCDAAQKEDVKEISPAATRNIASGAYEMGKLLEMLAVHRMRHMQLLKISSQIIGRLKDVL
jgi:hypothetical protein